MSKNIIDYATGKELRETPEEHFRQLFEHILIDDLGYPKDNIDIEVIIQRGSNRNAEEADIVVYKNANKNRKMLTLSLKLKHPKILMISKHYPMLLLLPHLYVFGSLVSRKTALALFIYIET